MPLYPTPPPPTKQPFLMSTYKLTDDGIIKYCKKGDFEGCLSLWYDDTYEIEYSTN